MKSIYSGAAALSAAILLAANIQAASQENDILPRASYLFSDGIANPASPEASSIAKYGEISGCNLYTGTFGYSIPIFTYQDKDFNIPIAISYSSNGYKPNIQTGILGLGWHLSAGWSLTREVMGIMDDAWSDLELYNFKNKYIGSIDYDGRTNNMYGYGFLHNPSALSGFIGGLEPPFVLNDDWVQQGKAGAEYLHIQRVYVNGIADALCFEDAPDIFHFSTPGETGSFILCPYGGYSFYDTSGPESPYCVTDTLSRHGFDVFHIRNADGYEYSYGNPDKNESWSTSGNSDNVETYGSWKLMSIEAPSGAKVTFNYDERSYSQQIIPSYTTESHYRYTKKEWLDGDDSEHEYGGTFYSTNYSMTESHCLSSIIVKNAVGNKICEISFNYTDKACESGALETDCKKLSGIIVRNSQNDIVRKCSFDYCMDGSQDGYSSSLRGMTFLKSVTIEGEGTYGFEYYDRSVTTFPEMGTWQMDWYGYWNPDVDRNTFAPQTLGSCRINASTRPWLHSLRQANTTYAKKGMLSRIDFPTGGYCLMSYEANSFSSDKTGMTLYTSGTASGVRISEIETYDADGSYYDSRTFSYVKENGDCSGRLIWRPEIYCQYTMSGLQFHLFEREIISTANDFPYMNGNFIEYPRVVESHGGGYVEYLFLNADSGFSDTYGSTVNSLYEPYGNWNVSLSSNLTYPFISLNSCQSGSLSGKLLSKTEYDGSLYNPVHTEVSTFENYGDLQYLDSEIMQMGFGSHSRRYLLGTRVTSVTEMEYSSLNYSDLVARTQKEYEYDNLHRISFVQQTVMGSDTITDTFQYHSDSPNLLTGRDTFRNGDLCSSEKYNYTRLSPSSKPYWYVPESLQEAQISEDGTPSYYAKMTFGNFDSLGNPRQSVDAAGNEVVYEWNSAYYGMYLTKMMVYPDGSYGSPLISSWTHKPLVGVTSVTSPSGKTQNYEYDEAGRLIMTKENGIVLNNYYYNIASYEN